MHRTQDLWIEEYKRKNALWIHDGNPKRPHALLTFENHSNGFFNSRLVIPDDNLLRDAADDLLDLFQPYADNIIRVSVVVGPQTGATKLARLLKEQLTARSGKGCFWASPAKSEIDGKKAMIFNREELELLPGHTVLLCEDVLTTGGSVECTVQAVTDAGGNVLPFVLALVNRSGLTKVNGKKIISLINKAMPMWNPSTEECPLCKRGSKAIPAKDPANWARLNASY